MRPIEHVSVGSCVSQHVKGSYNYLLSLRAVVAAASVRFHIRLVAGGVDAFLGKADHAFADLWAMVISFA